MTKEQGESEQEVKHPGGDFDASGDPATELGAKITLDGYVEADEKAVKQLGADLLAGNLPVFFYPASGFDWQPLHRFSHLCDVFVYADPRATKEQWLEERQALEPGATTKTRAGENLKTSQILAWDFACNRVLTGAVGQLAEMRNEAWTRIPDLQTRPAWGAVQRLTRHVGGVAKDIWLIFLAGSPLAAYERLFVQTRTAPECLALHRPEILPHPPGVEQIEEDYAGLWPQFAGWDGELGRLVRNHPASTPRLQAGNAIIDWPTRAKHYSIPGWRSPWRTEVYVTNSEPWPDLAPAPVLARRRVVVTRKPINPHYARSFGAVVLTSEKYHEYRWPAGVLVILSGPHLVPDLAVPDGPGVVNLTIVGIPLLTALAAVEEVCAARGITKVGVQGLPGFEDEAADLALWRETEGPVTELTIHFECNGHFIDFARAADEIA
jgi:hypothetical protein